MTGLITHFGWLGVFMLMVPESACIPVPSEVTLLFSGFAASHGWISMPVAIAAATAGNVVGSLLAYALGASHVLDDLPLAGTAVARSERLLSTRPLRGVFVARLLPLARTFVSLPAGARGLPLASFTALTAAGCALWATGFVLLGLVSGTAWSAVGSAADKAGLAIAAATIALLAYRRIRS